MDTIMTKEEIADYVTAADMDGFTLTPVGRGAAEIILQRRKYFTPSHANMLARVQNETGKLPLKLARLVADTRLGIALDITRHAARNHIRNQKNRARRKAARARYLAGNAA